MAPSEASCGRARYLPLSLGTERRASFSHRIRELIEECEMCNVTQPTIGDAIRYSRVVEGSTTSVSIFIDWAAMPPLIHRVIVCAASYLKPLSECNGTISLPRSLSLI